MLNPTGQGSNFNIQHAQTGKLLDSNQNGDAYLLPANNGYNQIWRWDNTYFTNFKTGRVLDGNDNGKGYTNRNNGGSYQKWTQVIQSGGSSKIRNQRTGRFLDDDASGNLST